MKGYSERHHFDERALQIWERATKLVESIPTHLDAMGREIRCHEVARALGNVFGLEVADGCTIGVDHSWLIINRSTLLDPYAPGRMPMVQLVDLGSPTLHRLNYNLDLRARDDVRADVVETLTTWMRM